MVCYESFTLIQGFHDEGCLLSMLLCIIVAEVLAIFIDANTRIKGTQIGDHEINFADDTIIFLKDFSCLAKIELISELSQKASSSKINFSKSQTLWGVTYKYKIDKLRRIAWSQFSIKMLEYIFIILPMIIGNRTKYMTI